MKIINFISGKDIGGPKYSFLFYSKILKDKGYDVVSVIRKGAKLADELKKENLEFREINYLRTTNSFFINSSVNKIKKLFEPINADIIIVHKQIDIELVKSALPNTKVIGVVHGFNAKNISKADALFAVSKKVKDFLIKNGYKKPIYVVPNMIENYSKVNFKGLSNPVKIGSMGVFRRKKGFHNLIEALKILKDKNIEFKATIAGRGKRIIVYKYLRRKYNLKEYLEFKPWIKSNERENFFDNLDIYVMPSRTESFGMVVAEAMGRGKIVVSTKCGGPEEIIDNEVNGFLVENQNPKAIANKIEEIVKNRYNIKEIEKNAYQKAMKEYDINSVGNKIDKLLKEIANE